MKQVMITLRGTQGLDGQEETVELVTEGTLEAIRGGWRLRYEEGELLGTGPVHSTLTVLGQTRAVMERSGEMTARLVVERGKRSDCLYRLPEGEMMMGLFGEKIVNALTETGGRIYLSYSLDADGQPLSRNQVDITVKEV